jgi:thymidine kinase
MFHTTGLLRGSLEVICGPMFSGKSEELIRRLRRAQIAKQSVATFKHSLDNRYALECLVSHNGNTIDAYPVDNEDVIYTIASQKNISIVGIDEAQFFSQRLATIAYRLTQESKKRVIIAGLDRDFRGAPFGCIPTLLSIADNITKLQAICTLCGFDAPLTQRLVNNKPAKYDDPIISIGAQESYQPRCHNCYSIDKTPFAHP